MANTKITGLTADTTPDSADLLTTVDDPTGVAVNKKATITNVITKGHGLADGALVITTGTLTSAGEGLATEVFTSNGVGSPATFQAPGAATLAATLTAGNSTGGTNIEVSQETLLTQQRVSCFYKLLLQEIYK